MNYDYLIFIGRFQPFHYGHKYIIEEGLKISKKLIIFCGSANQEISVKNPFTYKERKKFIYSNFSEIFFKKLYIMPLNDYLDDKIWMRNVEKKVEKITQNTKKSNIGIIGHDKDKTSYYLKLFCSWSWIKVENFNDINSTYIREVLFTANDTKEIISKIKNLVQKKVLSFLLDFLKTKRYLELKKQYYTSLENA